MNERNNDNDSRDDNDGDAIAAARADDITGISTGRNGDTDSGTGSDDRSGSSDGNDSQRTVRTGNGESSDANGGTGRVSREERATGSGPDDGADDSSGDANTDSSGSAAAERTGANEERTPKRTWTLDDSVSRDEVNEDAPLGYTKAGLPRKRRGRKPKDVEFDVVRPGSGKKMSYEAFATEITGVAFFMVALCRPYDIGPDGKNLWPLTRAEGEKLGQKIDNAVRAYVGLNPKLAKAMDKWAPGISLGITACIIIGPRIVQARHANLQRRQLIQARQAATTHPVANGGSPSATHGHPSSNGATREVDTQVTAGRDQVADTGLDGLFSID